MHPRPSILVVALFLSFLCTQSLQAVSASVAPVPRTESTRFTLLHITDLHGWINAHPHNATLNTDLGDFASLVTHMRANAADAGEEFLLLDTGDLIEGTGLSDATPVHGQHIFEAVERIKYDGMTIGNHDIGHETTVELMSRPGGFIQQKGASYVTSNSKLTSGALGKPFTVLTTALGHRILLLGNIFAFDQNANDTTITDPRQSVDSPAFAQAMAQPNIDLVISMNHIDPQAQRDQLLPQLGAIRKHHPSMPVVLLSGHRHVLYFEQYDDQAFTLESGKYFEHIGLIHFTYTPGKGISALSTHWYETTLDNFLDLAGTPSRQTFDTPLGAAIKADIAQWFKELDLGKVYGCAPHTYDPDLPVDQPDSFYGLWVDSVMPYIYSTVHNETNVPFGFTNTASLRTPLYKGKVDKNDLFSISPFADSYAAFPNVSGSQLTALIDAVKNATDADAYGSRCGSPTRQDGLGAWAWSQMPIKPDATYDIVAAQYDCFMLRKVLVVLFPNRPWNALPYATDISSTQALALFVTNEWPC